MRTLIRSFFVAALCCTLLACGGDDKPTNTGSNEGPATNENTTAEEQANETTPAEKPVLRFSAIPGEKAAKLKAKFDGFAKYLSGALEVPVEYVASNKYSASVSMFVKGEIHLAWFGGLTGVQARHRVPGSIAIAQGKEDPNYFSYFIANASAGITPSDSPEKLPEGLEGKTFTFGSERSTSGRLMPQHFIKLLSGKTPAELFDGEPGFSGAHDKTAKLIEEGAYDVGALSYKTLDKMIAAGEINTDKLKIIWKTPYYADYNFTAHAELDKVFGDGFTKKLTDAILAFTDKDILEEGFQRSSFIPAKNEDFAAVKDLAAKQGFLD